MKQIGIFFAAAFFFCLIFSSPAFPEGEGNVDKDYIKEHYPDVYNQIYSEGKKEGLREAEAKPSSAEKKAEPEAAVAATKAEELGDWWNHSSLKYEPMPSEYLLHLEGQYNYNNLKGNNSGLVYRGGGQLVARKDAFTDYVSYLIDKRRITQSNGQGTNTEYQIFQESLRFDIFRKLYAEGGFIWEKDKTSLINNRDIYYGGGGYHMLDLDRFRLDFFGAVGYETETYDTLILQVLGFRRAYHYLSYLSQDYLWLIFKWLTLHESFRIFTDFDKTPRYSVANDGTVSILGETNRYRWKFKTDLDFKLSRMFSLVTSYEVNYDNNPWPTVLKRDTILSTGIKFSY